MVTLALTAMACGDSESPLSPSPALGTLTAQTRTSAAIDFGEGPLADEGVTEADPTSGDAEAPAPEPEPPTETTPSPSEEEPTEPEPEPGSTPTPEPEPEPAPEPEPEPGAPTTTPEPAAPPTEEPGSPPPAEAPAPSAENPPPAPSPPPENPSPAPPPPADPDPPPVPVAPTGVSMDYEPSVSNTEMSVTWNSAPEGTYVVEFGSSPGLANLGSFEVSTTSFDFGNLPPGEVYSRVRTRIDAVVSDPSNEASVHYFDFRDYIEAIFLGTGPLTPTNGDHGCSATGWVRGFGSGSTVAVIASDSMSPSQMAAVQSVANQTSHATAGSIGVSLTVTQDPDPLPGSGEVTITAHPNASSQGCPHDGGCAIHTFVNPSGPGEYVSTRALIHPDYPTNSYAHEMGHGVLGLCHVDGNLIGGAGNSMMSSGPGVYATSMANDLTDYDVTASRAIHQAGIRAGDRKGDLVAAGLVNP